MKIPKAARLLTAPTIALLLAASCRSTPDGLVVGTLELVGGPSPGGPYPLTGTVFARAGSNKGKVVASARAGSDGGFQVRLPSGTFVLTLTSPLSIGGDCHSDPVTVSPHLAVTATVICGGP
jgi:hypothetical protein